MKQLLEAEYGLKKKSGLTITGKANILNNIVQIKINDDSLRSFSQDFSLDVKAYILSLMELADSARKDYDGLKQQKIEELFEQFKIDERDFYFDFLIRHLKKNQFEDEVDYVEKLKVKYRLKRSLQRIYEPKHLLSFLVNASIYDAKSLFLTLMILSCILTVILLPAPVDFMKSLSISITYFSYSDNFYLNHFINMASFLVGANDDIKIIADDLYSATIIVFLRIFYFIFITNLILEKLANIFNR